MNAEVWPKVKPDWWQCKFCDSTFEMNTFLTVARMRLAKLPNTYSGLDDHNRTEWECPKCKQWQSKIEETQ